jgi:hypothetical protein
MPIKAGTNGAIPASIQKGTNRMMGDSALQAAASTPSPITMISSAPAVTAAA